MKEFKNKQTEVTIPDESSIQTELVTKEASYAELCLICLRAPKEGGFGVEDMRKRFRIIDVLTDVKPTASVKLEDQDAALLQTVMTEFKWSSMHKDIIALTDHVAELKTVK